MVELMGYLYLTLVHPGFDKLRRGVGVIQRLRWYLFVVQDVVSLLACEGFCEWRVEMMEGLCFVFCCCVGFVEIGYLFLKIREFMESHYVTFDADYNTTFTQINV